MLMSWCRRPESAVSSVAEESLDVFELPASLQWLSRAASHPGAGPMEEEESDGEEPDIPVLGSAGGDGLGCLGSRASTPDSINEVQPPTAAPISAPMSGTKRAPNSQNRPKGGRSRPWFSRANQ